MNKIKIKFTKSQYKTLLKLLYLGEWMYGSFRHSESKDIKELQKLIYSFAEKAGLKDLIQYDDNMKMYYPTFLMEESLHPLIDEYDNYTFWDELTQKMAFKDFIEKYGEESISQMSGKKKMELEEPFIEKYTDEFETNGLWNLVIKE